MCVVLQIDLFSPMTRFNLNRWNSKIHSRASHARKMIQCMKRFDHLKHFTFSYELLVV